MTEFIEVRQAVVELVETQLPVAEFTEVRQAQSPIEAVEVVEAAKTQKDSINEFPHPPKLNL